MFCKNCGNQLGDEMVVCSKCGTPVEGRSQVVNVPSHMVDAIFTTIICPVTGIVALNYACSVKRKLAQGDYKSAKSASKAAFWWCTGTDIIFGLLIIIYLVIIVNAGGASTVN